MAATMNPAHILAAFLLASAIASTACADSFAGKQCSMRNNQTYEPNNTFEANLNALLANLNSPAAADVGFSTSSVGSEPDRAFGLSLCRGDIDHAACLSCLQLSASNILQVCPYIMDAIVWYENCLLRYSNLRFFGTMIVGRVPCLRSTLNITPSDASDYRKAVSELVGALTSHAAYNATEPPMFAAGQMEICEIGEHDRLYGMVQCTQDISSDDCVKCLNELYALLPHGCRGATSTSVQLYTASCSLRFRASSPFYNWSRELVLPPYKCERAV